MQLPDEITALIDRMGQTASQHSLSRRERTRILRLAHRTLLPRAKPGRKYDTRLDTAVSDYTAGIASLELYRKHIPNHAHLSRWRRLAEERRLMNSIYKRISREKARRQNHARNGRAAAQGTKTRK